MDKTFYVGIVERGASGGYGVYFPDLPGCVAVAESYAEVLRDAELALELHVLGMIEDGEALPAPTSVAAIVADPEVCEEGRLLVGVAADPPKVRVNVMLEPGVLKAIDMVSDNRSRFLNQAAKAKLREELADATAG